MRQHAEELEQSGHSDLAAAARANAMDTPTSTSRVPRPTIRNKTADRRPLFTVSGTNLSGSSLSKSKSPPPSPPAGTSGVNGHAAAPPRGLAASPSLRCESGALTVVYSPSHAGGWVLGGGPSSGRDEDIEDAVVRGQLATLRSGLRRFLGGQPAPGAECAAGAPRGAAATLDSRLEADATDATGLLSGARSVAKAKPSPFARLFGARGERAERAKQPTPTTSPTDALWRGFEESDSDSGDQPTSQTSVELSPCTRRANDAVWEMWEFELRGETPPAERAARPRARGEARRAAPPRKRHLFTAMGALLVTLYATLAALTIACFVIPAAPPAAPLQPPPPASPLQRCAEVQQTHQGPGHAAALAAVRCVGDEAGRAVLAFLKKLGRAMRLLFKRGRPEGGKDGGHGGQPKPEAARPHGERRLAAAGCAASGLGWPPWPPSLPPSGLPRLKSSRMARPSFLRKASTARPASSPTQRTAASAAAWPGPWCVCCTSAHRCRGLAGGGGCNGAAGGAAGMTKHAIVRAASVA
eukprot:Transcript_20556.p1 GENE.Transcript_20556~~Transcript_20556.p1  ORF type:complete len:527 (-),score=55.81 Transcript_20556:1075-2655(-)